MAATEARKKAMLTALEASLGVVTTACKIAKVSRSQHYKWCEDDPEYKASVDDCGEIALDFAESKLHKNIAKGKESSIMFYLKTKGKNRGYIERIQTEDLNPPVPLEIVINDNTYNAEEEASSSDG